MSSSHCMFSFWCSSTTRTRSADEVDREKYITRTEYDDLKARYTPVSQLSVGSQDSINTSRSSNAKSSFDGRHSRNDDPYCSYLILVESFISLIFLCSHH